MFVETLSEPVLRPVQGLHFRYAMPAGWRACESDSGLDLLAPDGLTGVSLTVLAETLLPDTPQAAAAWLLQQIGSPEARLLRLVSCPTNGTELETCYSLGGTVVRGCWRGARVTDGTRVLVTLRGYQAPERCWDRRRGWLAMMAEQVALRSTGRILIGAAARPGILGSIGSDVRGASTPPPLT